MSPRTRGLLRSLAGLAVLAAIVAHFGTAPLLRGLAMVDGWSLAAALGLTAITTVASAWRWRLVASGLGLQVPMGAAVTGYYRSQFLNSVLPGGVLGDVHRAVRSGRESGDLGRQARAVAGERIAGQVVQVIIALAVLLILPTPLAAHATPVLIGLVGLAVVAIVAVVITGRIRRDWPAVVLTSTVVVAGHATALLVAARTAGVTAPAASVLPLAVLILLAMTIPMSIGGWGPREGAAAWLFGAAGWGADQGLATATVYGVMALVATLPGVVVLVVERLRPQRTVSVDD